MEAVMDLILFIPLALILIAWLDAHQPETRDVDKLARWLGPTMVGRGRRR
jgi:hypothetical protein